MDKYSPEVRSRMMSGVKNAGTHPEIVVRKLLHRLGFRYRVNNRRLAGSPDIVLARHRKLIFVHGCFWHGHNCPRGKRPSTRIDFWNEKLDKNLTRDEMAQRALREAGWDVLVIWECRTKDIPALTEELIKFMDSSNGKAQIG